MWGGRFADSPDAIMEEINASIDFDQKLAAHDIAGSLAHVAMLGETGHRRRHDAAEIAEALGRIRGEIEKGDFTFSRKLEDIHMNIESRLADLLGPAAGRLHTARSRNDQVAVDFRLYIRATIEALDGQIAALQLALAEKALDHAGAVMPGFTHLQSAQPVTFGHHLLAYVEMLAAIVAASVMHAPGSTNARWAPRRWPAPPSRSTVSPQPRRSASTGRPPIRSTAFRIATSCIETLSARGALRRASVALRRGDRALDDAAIRLPAAFRQVLDRLVDHAAKAQSRRGRTGARQIRPGHRRADRLCSSCIKGLPLAYSKDMQEDKEGTFDALETLSLCLAAMTAWSATLSRTLRG